MKLEYVILAVLMAAAAVTAVIYFGQSLNQQTAVAAQATAGRTAQARVTPRAEERSAPASSRRIAETRDEEEGYTRSAATPAEPARDAARNTSSDLSRKHGAESLADTRSTTLRAGAATRDKGVSGSGPPDEAAASGNLLWLIPVVLIVGAGLVYILTSRLRN